MAQKKKYKLKLWPKVLLVVLILLGIGAYYGYQYYQEYLYKQSYEYKFLQVGYTLDEIKLIEEVLEKEDKDTLLTYEYNEFFPMFFKCKFFIFDNLDIYMTQVITQEDDFFKYHGTEGYDYDYIVAKANVGALEPYYENSKKADIDKNYSMLVNKYFELGMDYKPDDLVKIDWKYRTGMANDHIYIREEVYNAYLEMWNAAKNEQNIYLLAHSGFRDAKSQLEIYKDYEEKHGTSYADSIAARAGYSEHQTGLALDIYAKENQSQSTFKDSKAYKWLIENCYKYGFILRYPDGKHELTGYNYESWHYRYVGKELAKKVYDSGLTYDEYYTYYIA